MISKALFKRDFKISIKLWSVITAVTSLLFLALLFAASGMGTGAAMVIQQFFTLFAALIPIFFISPTASKLIAAQIDNGSFAYVMSAPLKRKTVVRTQGLFLIISTTAMYLVFTVVGLIAFAVWGELMELKGFFLLILGSLLVNLVIGGIAFLASAVFNSAGAAISIGLGVPLAFFLLYVVSVFFGSNKLLSLCKYITVHSLYVPSDIIACNSNMVIQFLILFAISCILYIAAMNVFNRKDLPL